MQSNTEGDKASVGSQEVGRCDGSKRPSQRSFCKTGKNRAILELRRAAIRLATEETAIEMVPEESNEHVSQTNGFVEQAVQAVERKVRRLRFSVEELHNVTLPPNYPLLVWAVEYASQITHRSHVYTG